MTSFTDMRLRVLSTTAITLAMGAIGFAGIAHAQPNAPPAEAAQPDTNDTKPGYQAEQSQQDEEIVITGSRIRRSTDTTSPAPVAIIGGEAVDEKGFTQVGEALNEMTSITPSRGVTPSLTNGQALAGQDFPNLFNLGPARTLSLVNGRRMVSSSSGLGDEAVDTNIIPTGLLDRVDVVQGGGAAVYGSGAIGGVINYVLKENYDGQQIYVQFNTATRGGYNSGVVRAIIGRNFASGRGNIAAEFDWSKSSSLQAYQRPLRSSRTQVAPNPGPGAGTNGVPGSIFVTDIAPLEDANGLVITSPFGFFQSGAVMIGGRGVTISHNGNIIPTNLGTPVFGLPVFVTGSQLEWGLLDAGALVPEVERKIGTIIGHYKLTDNIKVSAEFLAAKIDATVPEGGLTMAQFSPALSITYPALAPFRFTRTNPYLSPDTIAQLSAANPTFAAGGPLFLSKIFRHNIPSKYIDQSYGTDTLRGLVALEGNFSAGSRKFYWDLSYSHAEVRARINAYNFISTRVRNAANAARNGAGEIVCAINVPVVMDPACVPINIFGSEEFSQAALDYLMAKSGTTVANSVGPVKNKTDDVLATFSGDLLALPGGLSKFSLAYEYRRQSAKFTPLPGDLAGQFFNGLAAVPGRGSFRTHEFAGELEIPIIGDDFKLPLVEELTINGSYRYVDNSLAGKDSVWSLGGRWDMGGGLRLRGTKSRNFRAPSLNQVLAPPIESLGGISNPCSRTLVGSGPAPSVRAANCLALFTANPTFGLSSLPVGVSDTPANRLANFTANVIAATRVTTLGNPNLENEIAETTTFGFVFQPRFISGLVISADVLRLNLKDALTLFSTSNFAAACFDASPQSAEFCDTLTFDAKGDIVGAIQSTVNAGRSVLHAEVYNIDYRFPLSRISENLNGSMALVLQATHNTLQRTTVSGTTTRTDDTTALPEWVVRFDARYRNGPFALNYSLNYLPSALVSRTATVENSPDGIFKVKSNMRHDISAEYTLFDRYALRVGVNNIFDKLASFPTTSYGDMIGRQIFASLKADF